MTAKAHWEKVYSSKAPEQLGWYASHLQTSLAMIFRTGIDKAANIIDVGGGASTLVDDLLQAGFEHISVLDIASSALEQARSRLGARAATVRWLSGDVTNVELASHEYDLWHDRAVFHFLTKAESRRQYIAQMRQALKSGGHLVMATFAPEAPPKCSGLEVVRYSIAQLQGELGTVWVPREHHKELHITPGGVKQMYLYARFQKTA